MVYLTSIAMNPPTRPDYLALNPIEGRPIRRTLVPTHRRRILQGIQITITAATMVLKAPAVIIP